MSQAELELVEVRARRKRNTDALRHRGSSAEACALCHRKVFPTESLKWRGAAYHRACFRCSQCARSLAAEGDLLSHWCGGVPFCESCWKRQQLRKSGLTASTGVIFKGQTAAAAGLRRLPSHGGDVDGVLEAIGDELEAALDGMVPRCEICGAHFAAKDEVVVRPRGRAGASQPA